MSPGELDAAVTIDPATAPTGRASIASNATALTLATIASRVCSLGLAIALGRELGVSEYGRYGFAAALGTIIVPIADLGITSYVGREVARARLTGDTRAVHLGHVKSLLSLAALGLTAAAVLPSNHSAGAAAVIVIVVAAMLADGISSYVYSYFQGREQMGFQARATVAAALARSIGGIAMLLIFGTLLPVLLWILLVSAGQLAVAAWRFEHAVDRSSASARDAPVKWSSVIAMGLVTLFALVYLRADSVILGVVKNHRAVGLYTAAYTIVGAVQIIPYQIAQAVTPVFARTHAGDRVRFEQAWQDSVRIVLLLSLPMALVTTILAAGLLRIPYGANYTPASAALAVLVWAAPLSAVNSIAASALYGAGRERWPAVFSGIAVVVNLGLNVWAIPHYGIVGAAAVTVATEIAVLAGQTWFVLDERIARLPRLPYARLALALLVLAAVAASVGRVSVIAGALSAVLAYAVVLLASGAVHRGELRALRSA